MKLKKINYKFNWFTIFALAIVTEVIDLVTSPSITFTRYISIIVLICAIPFILYSLKVIKKADEDLRQNEFRLKSIFETLDVAIWSHDMEKNALMITPGIEKLYGYSFKDFYHDHELWKKVIYPDDSGVIDKRKEKLAAGEAVTSEYRIIRPDGEVRWIRDRGIPSYNESGKMANFNSVLFDITDRKESEDHYRSLVEMSPDIIAVVTYENVVYMNEAGWKLLGATGPEEIIGQSLLKFAPREIIKTVHQKVGSGNHSDRKSFNVEFQIQRLDGEHIDVEMSAAPILYEGRFAVLIVGRDISKRKEAERTIQNMAYYDSLTGLPNRNQFRKHLNDVLGKQKDDMLAVLFLDLDRFKIINDTKGHTVGDLILQKVAHRLTESVQNKGLVSRQGGDEFIILLENVTKEEAADVAGRILQDFSHSFEVNGQEFFVTPSIGISLYPGDGQDEETLIKLADTAMYQAKDRGKNNFRFYSSNLNGISVRKMEIENGLRRALELNQFTLNYQPQLDLASGTIVGVEALIRWNHPKHGFIPPLEFIPLAEETGLIVPIGKWVLREACRKRKQWEEAGLHSFPIAVNVSVRQFEDDHLIDFIKDVLEETGLAANQLELEITESIMQNRENSAAIISQLKELGVLLSIDDFGTGYSSLGYLKNLPIDKIKIDKSFVDDIIDHSHGTMVKTIIDMGLNLNFTVIAEGIEKEEQVQFLRDNSCEIGQGYFYSKPLAAEQIEPYLIGKVKVNGIPM